MKHALSIAIALTAACANSTTDGGVAASVPGTTSDAAASAMVVTPAIAGDASAQIAPTQTTAQTAPTPAPQATSKATLDFQGHPIEIDLEAEPGTHRTGEPWALVYRVKNLSAAKLYVVDGGDYRNAMGRQESYRVRASLNGAPVPVIDGGMQFGGMMGPHAIAPGHPYEQKLLVPRWMNITDAGTYLFAVDKKLRLGEGSLDNVDYAKTTELPTSVSVVVNVERASTETTGALIDAFGARMLGANDDDAFDAANRLDFVTDARAIKPCAAVVMRWGHGTEHQRVVSEAVHGLGRYGEQEARDALVFALGSSDKFLHLAVVQALAAQKTPESLAVLWTLQKDPDPSVRVTVVQAVASQNPPDAADKLRAMTKDTDATVANEANRLLLARRAGPKP